MNADELHIAAKRFHAKLKTQAEFKKTTAKYPMSGKDLAEAYNRTFSTKYTNVEVREIVRYLRRMRIPIASNGNGYWYAFTSQELAGAIKSLKERIKDMSGTLGELELLQREMKEHEENAFQEQPTQAVA